MSAEDQIWEHGVRWVSSVEIKFLDSVLKWDYGAPMAATAGAAAVDLRAAFMSSSVRISPGSEYTFSAGFAMHILNPNLAALIIPRSGLGFKGINLMNGTGLIDSDYQGEIKVKLINNGPQAIAIDPYDRIAQMIFVPNTRAMWIHVEEFSSTTDRGASGFGSTGKS